MSRRTRVPGPIQKSADLGNSNQTEFDGSARWISLDPLSSGWTLNDPDSTGTINSASVDTNGVRFQLEADNNSERWNQTNQDGPRYYKKLESPYGPLTFGDSFSVEFLVQRHAVGANSGSGNQDDAGFVVGIADSSCVSSTSDVEWVGLGSFNKKENESVTCAIGGDTSLTNVSTSTAMRRCYCWIGPAFDGTDADGNPTVHRSMALTLNDSNQILNTTAPSAQTHEFVGTDPVYLFLAPTFKSTKSGIADTDTTWKVWYRINHAPDGMLPSYVPGEGASS
tara:strand:- start:1253 stop:2095 length:843 start_codon:yes stop_codon:yes gene_type:complete